MTEWTYRRVAWLSVQLIFGYLIFNAFFGTVWCTKMPDLSRIPTPPSFIHEPNPDRVYFVIEQSGGVLTNKVDNPSGSTNLKERRFRCVATGYPDVEYTWTKNGKAFDLNNLLLSTRLSRVHGEGSFVINRLRDEDEGVYRCYASNGNGTAMDNEIDFRKTFINLMSAGVETFNVNYGDPFEKECIPPTSVPKARAYWILTSGENAERRLFQTINYTNVALNEQGKIFFQYVREEDNIPGFYYTCTAENSQLKDYKFGFQFNFNITRNPIVRTNLEPYILPQVQYYSPDEVTVMKGDSLELFCIVAGYPNKIPAWDKVGGELDYSRITWNNNFKKSIKIDNATFQDEGSYECKFPNDAHLDKDFTVTVEAAPYWIGFPPKDLNSSEGSGVNFDCNAQARPIAEITFYKNGAELKPVKNRIIIEGSRLTIKNIRKGDRGAGDNAVYQCKAVNRHGSLQANFYLNILAFAPVILQGPGTVTNVEGSNVTFSCKVFGSPTPKPRWKSDPQLMGTENVDFEYIHLDSQGVSQLKLFNVKRHHSGIYACVFDNIYNRTEEQGVLDVKNSTLIVNWEPRAVLSVGDEQKMRCDAEHDAALSVTYRWLFNGRPLTSTASDDGKTLTLSKTTGADTGNYTCVAETPFDSTSKTTLLLVRDVPPSPMQLSVVCKEKNADISFYYAERTTVSLLAEQNDPAAKEVAADQWLVQYSLEADEPDAWETYHTEVVSLRDNQGRLSVHLFAYGRFAFRALARNKIGSSIPVYPEYIKGDIEGRCVTKSEKPSRNPGHVQIQSNTEKSLIVNWEPLHRRDWNARHLTYLVEYKPRNETEAPFRNKTIEDPYRDSIIIDDVPSYTDYTVRVWAKNDEGMAVIAPREQYGKSGETAPSESPSNFRHLSIDGPSVASFAWDQVQPSSLHGEFKGYKIQYWSGQRSKKRSADEIKAAYFDREAEEGTIYNLRPNTVNYLSICVYNNYGDGPRSPTIEIGMPEGVPSTVQDVTVFPISHDEIGALWSQPLEMNGNFDGYELKICELRDGHMVDETCQLKNVGVDAFPETRIKGLNTSSPYRVEIRAKTKAGLGDPVSFDTETTRNYIPGPPVEPSVSKVEPGYDHLNVTWKPGKVLPDSDSPPGDSFYLQYREKGEEAWISVNRSEFSQNLTVTVTGLKPSTEYEVRTVSNYHGFNTHSKSQYAATHSGPTRKSISGWMVAIIVAVMILTFLLVLICLVVRSRGAKYPVSEKEKEQGREPMLKDDRGFGEYSKPDPDDDKKSLTAESVKTASETDSMAEYGDGDTGRFTEDGSFIGQYGGTNRFSGQDRNKKPNSSTFV